MDEYDVARKSVSFIPLGIALLYIVLVFVIIVGVYQKATTEMPPSLRAEMISLRFTSIPECFAYQDPSSGRVFPGMIDLTKFTNEQLESCYTTDPEKGRHDPNFLLRLASGKGGELKTNNYVHARASGSRRPVLIRDATGITNDELLIYIQVKA